MPLDANTLLKDGTTTLDENDQAATSTTNDVNGDGNMVLDIKGTGAKGMVAVMVCPSAPTAFADTLIALIQASDHITTDWKTIATFPTLYALNRRLTVKTTTAYVEASIGATVAGDSTADDGVVRWYDKTLETIGNTGDLVVSQVLADSDFDEVEGLTGATGVSTMQKVSVLTEFLSYGVYAVRFTTSKRYIRSNTTVTTGGAWGATLICVVDEWNFPISGQ